MEFKKKNDPTITYPYIQPDCICRATKYRAIDPNGRANIQFDQHHLALQSLTNRFP